MTVAGPGRNSPEEASLVRSEEELDVGVFPVEAGSVRARKVVEHERVEEVVPRGIEHAKVERTPAVPGDSGEVKTLPDGSISIPVFEEQLVVEKRLVVRERIILRKHTVTEEHVVEADLRRERVEVDSDPQVRSRVSDAARAGTQEQR